MRKKKILLFGKTGLLGSRIKTLLSDNYEIIGPSRDEVNLLKKEQVDKSVKASSAQTIIYAAGQTNQDKAEDEKELTMQLNSIVPKWISSAALSIGARVIYISSDAVFDGKNHERPYKETDSLNPVNYYGFTKAKGEEEVLNSSTANLVLRMISIYTSYYSRKTDFARKVIGRLIDHQQVEGIIDQYFNPTFSDDAVNYLSSAIEKELSGIIHIGSVDYLSNYNFIKELASQLGLQQSLIVPVKFKEFFKDVNVKRGQYPWLDVTKAQMLFPKKLHTSKYNIKLLHKQLK